MRTSARIPGAVAAAAIALLVGGCGSDGGGDGGNGGGSGVEVPDPGDKRPDLDDEPGGDGPPTGEDSGGSGSSRGGGSADPSSMRGSWATAPDAEGDSVAFQISSDNSVDMFIPGRCEGSLRGKTIDLTCTEGKKSYSHGTVESASGENMSVSWSNGRTTQLHKYDGLPERKKPDSPSDWPTAKDPF
ncbi:hypothetical protein [Streptomyces sp. 891-h]|uniref:hypothetical protein n=1 Tax=unclassified Streptomyces TaxID=2593676 RepID=UPI001FA99399|nr:hypothetical protein [Streptomyces sp. 891-h]UNZ17855.1 hypothetical protein HC362_13080 [Streptomyces sp. 891-h]